MNKKQPLRGFFDEQETLAKLSRFNDPLEKLDNSIDFEIFRETLNKIYQKAEPRSNVGAKPYDYVMMFKILILQRLYNLSDEQTEFQLNDRISFRRFAGLDFSHRVPDCNTLWNFKQGLARDNNERKLFDRFYKVLQEKNLIVNEGKMIDASFHETPASATAGKIIRPLKREVFLKVSRKTRMFYRTKTRMRDGRRRTMKPTSAITITSKRMQAASS